MCLAAISIAIVTGALAAGAAAAVFNTSIWLCLAAYILFGCLTVLCVACISALAPTTTAARRAGDASDFAVS